MHEVSLCRSVLDIIEASAAVESFSSVKRVWLEIGSLSCVEPEAMRFSFASVMRGTLADGAELIIVEVPAEARCEACGRTVQIEHRLDPCPQCGHPRLQIVDGDQMRIKELEVS